jgi:hypothetical protein
VVAILKCMTIEVGPSVACALQDSHNRSPGGTLSSQAEFKRDASLHDEPGIVRIGRAFEHTTMIMYETQALWLSRNRSAHSASASMIRRARGAFPTIRSSVGVRMSGQTVIARWTTRRRWSRAARRRTARVR